MSSRNPSVFGFLGAVVALGGCGTIDASERDRIGGSSGAASGGGASSVNVSAATTGGGRTTTTASGSAITSGAGGAAGGAAGSTAGGASGASSGGAAGSAIDGGGRTVDGGNFVVAPLDCGAKGTALENHGPPSNRLNYVIVADGYSQAELEPNGTLDRHLQAAMTKRFSDPIGQPYLRYRNFVNICVLRIASAPICGSSLLGCCGDDTSRLADCNTMAVNNAIRDNLPSSFEVDWRAVVMNGSSWWNSGGTIMIWSGGNRDAGGAALHEGGHGHNSLADEYGNCEQGRVSSEATYGVNVSLMNGNSAGKWDGWIGYNQTPGTGVQGFFGCVGNATWRPSSTSMMNSLFGDDPNTSFNPVSREKIIMDIWRAVAQPYDSVEPPAGAVTNPTMLKVNVIDPAVINVDWSVDDTLKAAHGGSTFAIGSAGLAPGTHTITARAYDNAGIDLVRQVPGTTFNRPYWGSGAMGHSDKTVTWTVTVP
jgi:hypothetical protein